MRARELDDIPFDVEGVELSHDGPLCSFDALLTKYGLADPALLELEAILRGADTARLDLDPQSAGFSRSHSGSRTTIATNMNSSNTVS